MKFSNNFIIFLILFLLTFVVYQLSSNGSGNNYNYFVYLADALVNGRLHLLDNPPWLNELVNWQGKYYVVFPPMPAVVMLPAVAVLGLETPQVFFSILMGSLNVGLSFFVFKKIFTKNQLAVLFSLLFGFGTIHWYHAQVGSTWYYAAIAGETFLWLMLLEALTKQRLFIMGLLIGAAYLSRLPMVLAVVFVGIYFFEQFISVEKFKIHFKNIFLFGLGVLPAVLLNFLYNYLRFGVIHDVSYSLLPVFDEPWYRYGLFSYLYIPEHLKEMFTLLPKWQNEPPFLIPSQFAMAVWFTTPAFLLIPFARFSKKIVLAAGLATLAIAIPSLAHGGNGFTQFGYRHTLDYMPFLMILTASGFRENVNWWKLLLVMLSIAVNLWGVVMITHLDIWTM